MPYMIDGETRLTDTLAIMVYICHKFAPELLGETSEDYGKALLAYYHLKEVKSAITGACYVGANPEQLKVICKAKMQPIVAFLGKKDFFMGENITFLDFILLEMIDFVQFLTNDEFCAENKSMARYLKRMKGKAKIKKFIASEMYLHKPFN